MPASTRYTLRSLRTPVQRTQWQRICLRQYATDGLREPAWFQTLREEMLGRTLPPLLDEPTRTQEWKLMKTLSSFVPPEWTRFSGPHSTLPLGHHLAYFNPATPSDKLLPDGTDTYHSPGEPYVRRMWAGGKLRMKVDRYYDKHVGWLPDTRFVCSEHIKDVQLRGSDDTAKIFVTIERRFARERSLRHAVKHAGERHERRGKINALSAEAVAFARQARESEDEDWGDASLVEERHLVFMKERSAAETEAIKEGRLAQTKYLQPPGQPEFSHSLTPTRSLLFRYSALTFNAHAIHLDPEYARNVEGHRNLLVHGPLSLTLMLALVTNHLRTLLGNPQTIQSIEYRNLAPLYCNEELRLCGREKTNSRKEAAGVYDVWIEGPTGGMAVKGTIRTAPIPSNSTVDGPSMSSRRVSEQLQDQDYDWWSSITSESANATTSPSVTHVESQSVRQTKTNDPVTYDQEDAEFSIAIQASRGPLPRHSRHLTKQVRGGHAPYIRKHLADSSRSHMPRFQRIDSVDNIRTILSRSAQ